MIKTFRGILADGTQQRVRLSTKKGKIGYRIIKFQIMPYDPTVDNLEVVQKIYKVKQVSQDAKIDFSDGNLLAAAYIENHDGVSTSFADFTNAVIFDREIFNQDIYITSDAGSGSASSGVNYYLELEMETLSDNAAAVSTLRDIRLNPQVGA